MYINEKEFDESLKKLGDLYEEGKDCLNSLPIARGLIMDDEKDYEARLFEILREMRDLSAITMKKLHWQPEN